MATEGLRRVVCLVADGFGVGEAPDADRYGDSGANTMANTAKAVGGLRLPSLERLGLGCLGTFEGVPRNVAPEALVTRLGEKSAGKDTTTGHWELAGIVTERPFAVFPEGFPSALVDAWVKACDLPGVLGNKRASGTVILDELAAQHVATGKPILYTSGDSVFQVAAHETHFGLERLYRICEVARSLVDRYDVGRVIARPFVGEKSTGWKRTEHRRDYSVAPGYNLLDALGNAGVNVCSVGKIDDIFAHRGMRAKNHTGNNRDTLEASLQFLKKYRGDRAFIFANLVDFDQLYGHRRDPKGYANALVELDRYLPTLLEELEPGDLLLLTSDHGCDPTFRGTDHTREFVPLVAYAPGKVGRVLGDRDTFSDVAATVLAGYRIADPKLAVPGHDLFHVSA
jgi:phosphopentomutase